MKERRKRLQIPKTILFFGILFLFLPVINYLGIAYKLNHSFTNLRSILNEVTGFEIILMAIPPLIGIQLLRVKKTGWWLFLIYAIVLITYNFYSLIKNKDFYNLNSLFQTILFFGAIFYFLRRDISAPYIKLYPRGWRGELRNPVQIQVRVNSVDRLTKDISEAGFYLDWKDVPLEINEEVTVEIETESGKTLLSAGVVRKDENGAGFAFRRLAEDDNRWIQKLIQLNS